MAKVRTFFINPGFGVPDKDIREWLTTCEETELINVSATFVPAYGADTPRLVVIVTKLDDKHDDHT